MHSFVSGMNNERLRHEHKVLTHDPFLPWSDGPSRSEVFHDQYVRDHALVVTERDAPYRREYRTSDCIAISEEANEAGWAVGVRIRIRAGWSFGGVQGRVDGENAIVWCFDGVPASVSLVVCM